MKTVVIYYSLGGNTHCIAKAVADALKCDLYALTTKRAYPRARWLQMVVCGASVSFKLTPKLKGAPIDVSAYDNVILGAPVWAGTIAAPMATFLKTYSLTNKNVALFACHAGGGSDKFNKRIKERLAGSRIVGQSDYKEPLKNEMEQQIQQAKKWAIDLPL